MTAHPVPTGRDASWLAVALALSERGRGRTGTNPNVGCVIVREDRVIGRGWTQPGGRPHAEAMALAAAGGRAQGATAYVSLEPCAHQSARGPCCAESLIAAGVARVVAAATDPDPRTAGKGFAALEAAGIIVVRDAARDTACAAMAGFFRRQNAGRPFVTLKLATSLDGQIAMADGQSRWITGDAARAHAHLERARSDAILVGRGTAEIDRPALDVRLGGLADRSPQRFMLGSGPAPTGFIALHAPDDIRTMDGNWLLVEGGAQTAASFLRAGLVDRLMLYRAPILIGQGKACVGNIGLANLAQAHDVWRLCDARTLGKDRLEVYERTTQD